MTRVSVISAATDMGVNIDGSKEGALKLGKNFDSYVISSNDVIKNNDKNNKEKNINEVNSFNEKLYNKVLEELNNNKKVITIGGDHSIAIASAFASNKHDKCGIIWIDSHADYNTFETTITGNIHGLPLAAITGYNNDKLRGFHDGEVINQLNAVIIGARDIDELEKENLKKANVTVFSTEDIKTKGIENILNKAFEIATKNVNKVHISFDIDVIDPSIASGVSVPAKNGINEEETIKIIDEVLKHKELINTFDVVEYNPLYDKNSTTYDIALNIINKIKNGLE